MKDSDFNVFSEIMTGFIENYSTKPLSSMGLILRFEALKEFSLNQISKAVTKLLKTCNNAFIPTIAEIIEVIKQDEGINTLTIEQQAEVQANKVIEFLKTYGRSKTPQFTDSITQRLMTGRWSYYRWAATVEEADLKWWQKDFIRAYSAISKADPLLLECQANKKLEQFTTGILKQIPELKQIQKRAA